MIGAPQPRSRIFCGTANRCRSSKTRTFPGMLKQLRGCRRRRRRKPKVSAVDKASSASTLLLEESGHETDGIEVKAVNDDQDLVDGDDARNVSSGDKDASLPSTDSDLGGADEPSSTESFSDDDIYGQALHYAQHQAYDAALECIQKALAQKSDDDAVYALHQLEAQIRGQQGRYEESLGLYQALLAQDSTRNCCIRVANVHYACGRLCRRLGRDDQAINHLTHEVESLPVALRKDAHLELASLYTYRDTSLALKHFRQALRHERDPDTCRDILHRMGRLVFAQDGSLERAMSVFWGQES